MNLIYRFSFFFIGISLGLVLVFLSLKMRENPIEFDYFPNSRVKKQFLKKEIMLSEKAICKMNCHNFDTLLSDFIMRSKVDFKKSKIRGFDLKTYYLFFSYPDKNLTNQSYLLFQTNDDSINLIDVFFNFSSPFYNASGRPLEFNCQQCY